MPRHIEDIKIFKDDDHITWLIEEANYLLLCADKSIKALPEGKNKDCAQDCLSETCAEFVYETTERNAPASS